MKDTDTRRVRRQRGFVLLTMAASAIAVLGALGLAVDIGRMFIVRNETQAFCDSAAVMAATYLNNTSAAVQAADVAAKATAIKWNFSTTVVANPTVEYATSPAGPWSLATAFVTANTGCSGGVGNSDPACGYKYVRVTTNVQLPLYFLPVVSTIKTYNQKVVSRAIAGQVDISSGTPAGPYTGVAQGCYTGCSPVSVTAPNFGLTPGNDTSACINGTTTGKNAAVGCYDIQWPHFNGTSSKCATNTGGGSGKSYDGCFVSPPCANDQNNTVAEVQVVSNWASSSNGYWGAQSASSISAEVIDYLPNPSFPIVGPGSNIFPVLTNGQQQSQSNVLDERVNQDGDNYDTLYSSYLTNPSANGRRLMILPIVYPSNAASTVVQGFGMYFLLSNASKGSQSDYYKKNTNGNSPYCAMYIGPGCVGCRSNGVGGTTGASAVKLVQ